MEKDFNIWETLASKTPTEFKCCTPQPTSAEVSRKEADRSPFQAEKALSAQQ